MFRSRTGGVVSPHPSNPQKSRGSMKATKFVAVLAVAGLALAACGDDDDDDSGDRHHGGAAPPTPPRPARPTRPQRAGPTPRRRADRDHGSSGRLSRQGAARDGHHRPRHRRRQGGRQVVQPVGVGRRPGRPPRTTGGTAEFIETAAASDYATNIGQFVDSGANVIVTVGFALGEATAAAAAENPDITFIGVDQFQAATVVQPDRPALPRGPGRASSPAPSPACSPRRTRSAPCSAPTRSRRSSPSRRAGRPGRCTPTPRST